MNASDVSKFCQIKELHFVEQGQHDGQKGFWFENRKYERSFFCVDEIEKFSTELSSKCIKPVNISATFTS
ncbi:MAG: hypothetical protein L3J82_02585 [Planctomycetes bacterium]|nr:hypothetical protein [Planctomycetota bacterium]